MLSIEKKLQQLLSPFLRGPDLCQFALLRARSEEEYRSSGLALLAWGIALLRRFCYPALLYLGTPCLLLLLMLIFFPEEPLWGLVWLAAGILLTELLLGFLCRPRVTVARHVPPHVDEGENFTIRFTVTNRGRLTTGPLALDPFDYCSFALPTWHRAQTGPLKKGDSVTVDSRVAARKRGVWQLYRARAGNAFPFGLIRFQSIAPKAEPSRLYVWPRRLDAAVWQIAEKTQDMPGGPSGRSVAADQMAELAGVREYRPGDPLRQIDWIGTARRGEFLVKQWETPKAVRRLAVYVDVEDLRSRFFRCRHLLIQAPSFERVLSVARTLLTEASRHGVRPVRLCLGEEPHPVRPEMTAEQGTVFLCNELATAFSRRRPKVLLGEVAETVTETIVILQRDDPYRRAAVVQLRHQTAGRLIVLSVSPLAADAPPGWVALSEARP